MDKKLNMNKTEYDPSLSNRSDIAAGDEQADLACKRILSEKIILAWILKYATDEYRHLDVEDIAEHTLKGNPKFPGLPSTATRLLPASGA